MMDNIKIKGLLQQLGLEVIEFREEENDYYTVEYEAMNKKRTLSILIELEVSKENGTIDFTTSINNNPEKETIEMFEYYLNNPDGVE